MKKRTEKLVMEDMKNGGAQDLLAKKQRLLTQNQLGLSKKQMIIPSFETTAKLYGEHFMILRELKYRIDLLKQSYYGQMDKKKTWD